MSKTQAAATAATKVAAPAVDVVEMTIVEFCTRLSETDRRPELIGAFAAIERSAGHHRDTAEQFQARYAEFINKPV